MYDFSLVIVKNDDAPDDFFDESSGELPNKKVFTSAVNALQHLEQNPANVLIAEYDMPEMNGLDLLEAIRDIDAERNHFTWIIVTGGQADASSVYQNPDTAPDAFIERDNKSLIRGSVLTGNRLAARFNHLMEANSELEQRCESLEKIQLLDPVTGLGNRRFAEQTLQDSTRQIESRGGAVCFILLSVQNYTEVLDNYDENIASALVVAISDRIQHLVRPLDVVTSLAPGEFALILIQPSIEQCTAACYQRIFDGVRLKSYKTAAGFLDVRIAMSICAATAETGSPDPSVMIRTAQENLAEAARMEKIVVKHLTSGL